MKKALLVGAMITAISAVALTANAAPIGTQYGQTINHDGYDVEVYTPSFTTTNTVNTISFSGWQYFSPSASYTPNIKYTAVKRGTLGWDTAYSSTSVDGEFSNTSWFPTRQLPSVPKGTNVAIKIYMKTGNYGSIKFGGNIYDGL